MFKKRYIKQDAATGEGSPAGGGAGGAPAVDILNINGANNITGHGSVAMRLLQNNMSVNALRTNEVLHKDEWKQYDSTVVEVAKSRLLLVGDLIARGLTYSLSNALGTTLLQWEQANEITDAEVSMTGLSDTQRDKMGYGLKSLPIPLIHKDFQLNIRALEASRKTGQALDTTQVAQATRRVAEMTEKIFVQGYSLPFGGGNIYGMKTLASRNTGNLTSNWADTANTTGEEIVADVLRMIDALVADNMYGPYVLYVPTNYHTRLGDDYKANGDRTIMERILAIPGISGVLPTSYLTGGASGEVVLMQATSDVVDVVDGLQPTPVSWDSHGGFVMNFKVMSIMIPRVKDDASGQCGIAHFVV